MGLAAGVGGSSTPGALPRGPPTDGSKTKCNAKVTASPGASDKTMGGVGTDVGGQGDGAASSRAALGGRSSWTRRVSPPASRGPSLLLALVSPLLLPAARVQCVKQESRRCVLQENHSFGK